MNRRGSRCNAMQRYAILIILIARACKGRNTSKGREGQETEAYEEEQDPLGRGRGEGGLCRRRPGCDDRKGRWQWRRERRRGEASRDVDGNDREGREEHP